MPEGLRILGPLELVGRSGALPLGSRKERCLLAALAVEADKVVAEERLVDALWGDTPPRTAIGTLRTYVLRLRGALTACDGLTIVTRHPGYVLITQPDSIDAAVAERLVSEARRAADGGRPALAARALTEALSRWRGASLLDVADQPFARASAARWDELHDAAQEDLVDAELELGHHRDVVGWLEEMVRARPLREHRWAQLMLALYRDGRQREAIAVGNRLRATLTEELGVEPSAPLRDLEIAVRRHDPSLLQLRDRRGAAAAHGRGGPARLVGREDELRRLCAAVADAEEGRGGAALVCGEAGIGKTRLLAEMAARAESRGAVVLSGRCLETGGALPYQPFAEAVGNYLERSGCARGTSTVEAVAPLLRLLPRWTDGGAEQPPNAALQPDELRLRAIDGTVRFLTSLSDDALLVVQVDDVHWADAGTVSLLRHLVRAAPARRLLVVAAYRDGELPQSHPLVDALAELHSGSGCTAVRLSGLHRTATRSLLGQLTGRPVSAELAAAVSAETSGNPFFARELVRHLMEEGALTAGSDACLTAALPLDAVPDGVRQVIARRRRRLSAAADGLLRAACTIEGPFPFGPVAAVAGLDTAGALDALDELLQSGLVGCERAPEQYAFAHALVRHAVYRDLSPSRRLRLHRRMAVALDEARATGQPVDPAEIAVQYGRSAALPGAAEGVAAALAAAERARTAGAHDEQATMLRLSCELAPPTDPRLPDLQAALAAALAWSLQFDDAVQVAREAAASVARTRGRAAAAAVLADVATTLAAAGSNRRAWALASTALRSSEGTDDVDEVTWAALTVLDIDRREADDPGNPGIPLDAPGRKRALRVLYESGRLARRGDLSRYAVAALYGSRSAIPAAAAADPTVALYLVGDYARAAAGFARESDVAASRGQLAWEVYCRSSCARALTALGNLHGAQAALTRSRELAGRIPDEQMCWQLIHHEGAEDCLAMALDTGWPERLARMLPLTRPDVPEHRWGIAPLHGITARVLARLGRPDQALPLLSRPVRALSMAPPWAPNYTRMACDVAETLWLLDRRDHLSVVEAALRESALPADFRFPLVDGRQALGRLCALDGRAQEARRWFAAARTVLEQQEAWPLRAVVDHDEALLHLRRGDAAAARPWRAKADEAFLRLGMTGWSERLARAASVSGISADGGARPFPAT